jgi:Zn-dependent M28 family amino/carboxypeptidase
VILMVPWLLNGTPSNTSFVKVNLIGAWRDGGRSSAWTPMLATIQEKRDKTLVMVSFKPLSSFSNQLKDSVDTQAYFSSSLTGVGRAIVEVNSPEAREALAAASHEDISSCGGIEDLDLEFPLVSLGAANSPVVATSAKSAAVVALLSQVSSTNLKTTVTTLQDLGTRYHASASPNTPSDTIKTLFESNSPTGGTAVLVDHSSSKSTSQKSVVLTIAGTSDTSKTVVLGAHLDSINHSDETKAPGADDNASGIAALTEILRILKANNATFARNIEIHAYAAEEVGLMGSADIAATAALASKNVTAMLQLDMIGYSATANDQVMHIITTDTSPVLVRHLKDLTSSYLDGTWETGTLAAGTSDHKSWTTRGFHAAFAFEHPTIYNHALHTSTDTTSLLDFGLASRFTKLSLAFLAHEAGLNSAVSDTSAAWTSQKGTVDTVKLSISTSSVGGYRIAATVPDSTAATSAEFCKVTTAGEVGCQSLNTATNLAKTSTGKIFFVTTADVSVSTDEFWRLNAYDSKGLLVGMRTVKLKKI